MPTLLSTTVRHIYDRVPNSVNSKLIEDFLCYMKDNATSSFSLCFRFHLPTLLRLHDSDILFRVAFE